VLSDQTDLLSRLKTNGLPRGKNATFYPAVQFTVGHQDPFLNCGRWITRNFCWSANSNWFEVKDLG
jgi:hypothetical protein